MKRTKKQSELVIVWLSPKDLKPYDNNAKIHTPEQIEQIIGQISQFGFDVPIVVLPDKTIIKGHGRREASLKMGLAKVPCIVRNLTKDEARAARLGDNRAAEAEWNHKKLNIEFKALSLAGFDLPKVTAFPIDQIKSIQMTWKTDHGKVANDKEHLEGIRSTIKVRCEPENRDAVKDFIVTKLAEHGFQKVDVE